VYSTVIWCVVVQRLVTERSLKLSEIQALLEESGSDRKLECCEIDSETEPTYNSPDAAYMDYSASSVVLLTIMTLNMHGLTRQLLFVTSYHFLVVQN